MGNSLGIRKNRTAKIMKIDGTAFRLKPPVSAGEVLKNHPGFSVLDAEEVKSLGVRARPLAAGDPIRAGRLYFLVHLPRLPTEGNPRRAYSGNLRVSAKDRLESLLLSRRAVSDLAVHHQQPAVAAVAVAEKSPEGGMRLRMRLPKAEVAKLMEESRDAGEITKKIMELAASVRSTQEPPTPGAARKEFFEVRILCRYYSNCKGSEPPVPIVRFKAEKMCETNEIHGNASRDNCLKFNIIFSQSQVKNASCN